MFGNCTYALQVCYLNQKALRQKIGYKQEIKRTYVIPLLASLVMGAIVLGVYYGLFTLTHRVFLPLILSVVVGVFVYFVMIMEYGNKNIVCFVIHRIKLVILEDITDSGE